MTGKLFRTLCLFPGFSLISAAQAVQEGKYGPDAYSFSERLDKTQFQLEMEPDSRLSLSLAGISDKPTAPKLLQIALILPPKVAGIPVRSNHISISYPHVFTSYNKEGSIFRGAIESISIEDIFSPTITSQILFENADINSIYAQKEGVYAVGASRYYQSSPAFVSYFPFVSSKLLVEDYKTTELPSFAATDVLATQDTIFALSGSEGGVSLLKPKTLEPQYYQPIHDVRSIARLPHQNKFVVLSADPTQFHYFSTQALYFEKTTLGDIKSNGTKASLLANQDLIFAALSDGGLEVFCSRDLKSIAELPALVLANQPPAKTVTNGVAVIGDYIFTANGEAGVAIYHAKRNFFDKKSSCGSARVIPMGKLILGRRGVSANHLAVYKNFLFVADGSAGLKILRFENKEAPWKSLLP